MVIQFKVRVARIDGTYLGKRRDNLFFGEAEGFGFMWGSCKESKEGESGRGD